MLRWTLTLVVLLALAACGSDEEVKEPGEKVVAGAPGGAAPPTARGPETPPSATKAEGAATAEAKPPSRGNDGAAATGESSTHDANGDPITDPEDLPGRDEALEIAVESGLHETDTPPPPAVKPVIELDEKGRITGPIPDMAPDIGFLFDTENFVCPGDSMIQGARPPKGRELGCRKGGMLVGPFIEWYPNDHRRVEKRYVGGVKQGPARQWYRDGSLQAIRYFRRGRPDGLYARWHVNGRIAEKGEYDLDKEIGPWIAWYPNGKKESEGMYILGRKEGPWTYWHPNGQKQREGTYHKGQKVGVWTFWYENGQLEKEGQFVNDYPAQRLRIYAEDGSILQ
jgi:antitoxin component YwqK of YwqJK toxin-antitoxin module